MSGARRLHRPDGTTVHHHLGVSAFADYATVSRHSLVKVDKDLPLNEAALFGCAVLTGVGAVFNTAQIPAGSSVAVIGLGGVGLASLLGAVAAGARQIVAMDLSEHKLAFARELGATDTFNARDPDIVAEVKAATGGGVEYAFEMAGSTRAWTVRSRSPDAAAPPSPPDSPPPPPPSPCTRSPWSPKNAPSKAATSAPPSPAATSPATSSSTDAADSPSTDSSAEP